MSFAKRLKQALDERQMTQAELADLIGKGRSSVSQYLSGKNIPRKSIQEQIAKVLDCSVDFLNSEVPEEENDICLKNVSVVDAARKLGISPQSVRIALQTGVAPFGFAVKNKSVYTYHISPKKLAEYIGA